MDKNISVTLFMNALFGRVEPDLKKAIEQFSFLVKSKKRDYIFREGDRGSYLYFLVKGSVKLFKVSKSGKEVIVKIVNSGEIFAEVVIIEPLYPVNAVVLEDSVLLKIDAKMFWEFLETSKDLNRKIFLLLLQRIKNLLARLELVGTESVEERLLHYLKSISAKKGKEFDLPISKGELAALLFTSPETISRTFNNMREKGLIEVEGKKIVLKKVDKN